MTTIPFGQRCLRMFNVIISGPFGRMGQALCRLANESENLRILGGVVPAHEKAKPAEFPLFEMLSEVSAPEGKRVLIDFTQPEATVKRVREAAELGIPVVIGTTGFSDKQLDEIQKLSEKIPVLRSANMSVGINLLSDIVKQVAAQLAEYDIEIIETHHRLKKDAPSGTALLLAEAAAAGREVDLAKVGVNGRAGLTGERSRAEIGLHAVRGGDVVGDHTVLFATVGERLEFTHKASSRDTFASGALFAAQFLVNQGPGLYSMKDALGREP